MTFTKPRLSFWQIINMNVGFFGIQYSFALQQNAVNPIYKFLGAENGDLPMLQIAGPVTGLIIQPIIGAMSDKTWHPKFGRRKPYFLIGALLCSICLFLFPFSKALWMAVGLLWILDAANNTAMEPYRAFVADKLSPEQQPTGFLAQSFFTGFGQTLGTLSLFLFQLIPFFNKSNENNIPYWVFGSFFFGAVCSIGSVLWSNKTTPEIPPTAEELSILKNSKINILTPFIEIGHAIKDMPSNMWKLFLVYLFQWFALKCYWDYKDLTIAKTIFNTTDSSAANKVYQEAVGWGGLISGWTNIITFLSAFVLVWFARKKGAKIVHIVCLLLASLALFTFPQISDKYLVFIPLIGFGIAWASMMGVPYLLIVNDIPKTRYGVYMGIINMMIVIPMFIYSLTFGKIFNTLLSKQPVNAIYFGATFLLIAALATLLIKSSKPAADAPVPMGGGH
ncbi:MAG: MFS transporter [Flavihumibacter sp.]|nr:MFS transporter [Flavihumibacter sp.]